MLLLPLGTIFVMLRNNERKQPVEVATVDILPGETKATLILADGKSIVLQHDTVRDIVVSEGVNAKNSGGGIVYFANGNEKRENLQYNVLQTPRGGEYQITLADGSMVQLNSGTQLKISGGV